jgi:hypothetical protein
VCVAPPLVKAFGLTTATWITLEPPSDLCALSFLLLLFFSLSLDFLAGKGVVFGIRKILNNREEPADLRSLPLPTRPLIQTGLVG